jgi:hypothetical protein
MVGEIDEWNTIERGMRQPASEVDALRHEQGEVVEARVPMRTRRARLLDEHEQLAVAGVEHCPFAAAHEHA